MNASSCLHHEYEPVAITRVRHGKFPATTSDAVCAELFGASAVRPTAAPEVGVSAICCGLLELTELNAFWNSEKSYDAPAVKRGFVYDCVSRKSCTVWSIGSTISRVLFDDPPNAMPIGRPPVFEMCVYSALKSHEGVGVSANDILSGSQIERIGERYGAARHAFESGRGDGSAYRLPFPKVPSERASVEYVCTIPS